MATSVPPPALLAFYEDHEHTTPFNIESFDWDGLVDLFSEHEQTSCSPCPGGQKCKAKFGVAFSPGVPRQGQTRADKNIEHVSMLVYDFDHLWRSELEALCDRLAPLASVLYSTHSHLHGGPDDNCVRVVLPFSRPLAPDEFRFVHREVRKRYGLEWQRPGSPALVGADPTPKDLSRLYFMPTAPIGVPVESGHQDGELLDLAELLRELPSAKAHTLVNVPLSASGSVPPSVLGSAPISAPTIDMEGLRRLLKGYSPQDDDPVEGILKKDLVRRVYRQEALVKPEEGLQREKSCHRLGKILAYLLPPVVPCEAVAELVRPSLLKMPVYSTDGEADTLEARLQKVDYSWRRGLNDREAAEQEERAKQKPLRELLKRRRSSQERTGPPESGSGNGDGGPPVPPSGGGSPPPYPASSDGPMTEDRLNEVLHFVMVKGQPVLLDFLANVIALLSLRPEWEHALKYNEITKNVELHNSPLESYETRPAQVVTGVQAWLQRQYVTNFKFEVVERALIHVAKGNAYNPLRDYLNSLQADARSRVDTFLETYCGATLTGVDGADITEYVRKVSRRWLVSAVARAMKPGCKMDTVLILEGRTGIYKSTALKALAGPFFSDSKIVIGEKDAMQLAGTNWIHEIAELTAFHASETETQKAFFSSPVDQFRAPYDRVPDKYPRLACFVGSTNDERYMNDHTGNRRYWPVQSDRMFKIQELRRDRDLIWAEAVKIYKTGLTCLKCQVLNVGLPEPWHEQYAHKRCETHRWWFEDEENDALEKINLHRLRAEYSDAIRDYILRIDPENRKASYTFFEIATDMLKIPTERIGSQSAAIGRALKVLGFTKERTIQKGEQVRHHTVPELIMKAPHKKSAFQEMHAKREEAKAAK